MNRSSTTQSSFQFASLLTLVLALLALASSGCGKAHEDLPIASGLYTLKVKTQNGTCSNLKQMEQTGTAVVRSSNWLNLEMVMPKRVSIHADAPTVFQMTLACQNAPSLQTAQKQVTLERTFSTPKETDSGFELQYEERWYGDEGCVMPAQANRQPVDLGCTEHGTLVYTLDEPCESPCELTFSQSRASCSCA